MGSPWTDESAILRDLSFAQGRWVPGGIDSAAAGAKPPAHNITEETEEEYFRHWTTDEDFSTGPDLIRIKTMLELMQDEEVPVEDICTGPLEIRKPNLPASMFRTKNTKNNGKENKHPVTHKPRRVRNVAIASILAFANQVAQTNPGTEPLKLSKPEDFIKPKQDDDEIKTTEHEWRRKDSVNKVTNWLQAQDITSMFKKKPSVNSLSENTEQNNITDIATITKTEKSPVQCETRKSPVRSGQYTPSSWATEYYKRAVDRSHMRDLVREDIWSRAEKAMKEIDTQKAEEIRRQQEEKDRLAAAMAAAAEADDASTAAGATDSSAHSPNTNRSDDALEGSGIAYVLLPQSRHDLGSSQRSCVVCAALTAPAPPASPPGSPPSCPPGPPPAPLPPLPASPRADTEARET